MQYFPDIIAFLFLFPNGFISGIYLKLIIYMPSYRFVHWYALAGVGSAMFFAIFMTVKKSKDKLYRFDHFYVIFHGLVWIFVCSIFLWKGDIPTALYFGFTGNGIIITPCYTYISIRSSKSGYRPARIAFANCINLIGLTFGFGLFMEDTTLGYITDYEYSGWILIGTSIILAILLAANEIMQLTHGYNYKKSRDDEWNQNNILGILFMNQQTILEHYYRGGDWCQYLITKSRLKRVVICIFLIFLGRIIIFSPRFLAIAIESDKGLNWNSNLSLLAIGAVFGSFLLIWIRAKIVYLIFCLVKIAGLIAILVTFNMENSNKVLIFYWVYYAVSGIISSISIQGILEVSPFKYTELIFAFQYSCEILLLEAFKYEYLIGNIWTMILSLGIVYLFISVFCIILLQVYLPNTSSLIEIRNILIGLRRANFTPNPKIWYSNWFIQRRYGQRAIASVSHQHQIYS